MTTALDPAMPLAAARAHSAPHALRPLVAGGADPLYKQVRASLVDSLCRGEWKPGDALPNERSLAERYGVGVATIRAAIGELAAMHVLVRRQGKGTFVCRE